MTKSKYCYCSENTQTVTEDIQNIYVCLECRKKHINNTNETILYCNECATKLMVCNKCGLQINLFD